MFELVTQCSIVPLSPEQPIVDFDCGNDDLNDFFNNEAIHYQNQLLGQTYFFRHNGTHKIVCAFSFAPDGLKTYNLPGSRRKKVKEYIPREKSLQSYPAFLIGRLGVASEFAKQGVGSQLIEFIKHICFNQYKNLCRFLLVDAYNNPDVLNFYWRNDFMPVFFTEEQEREYYNRPDTEPLRTRFLFYDMIHWKNRSDL